jgi:ankyrin repeat protein
VKNKILCLLALLLSATTYTSNIFAIDAGKTIHQAAKDSDVNAVQSLLDGGIDVNAPDEEGCTPLHYAAREYNVDVVRALMNAGANATINWDGMTPIDTAARVFS